MCYSPVTYLMEITTVKICPFRHKINSNGFFFPDFISIYVYTVQPI